MSEHAVNSSGLRFSSKTQMGCNLNTSALLGKGEGAICTTRLRVLSNGCCYGALESVVPWLFSSLLQMDAGILNPRGKGQLWNEKSAWMFARPIALVNEKGGSHMLNYPTDGKACASISVSLSWAFGLIWNVEELCLFISVGKEKGSRENPHPPQEKRTRDRVGCC